MKIELRSIATIKPYERNPRHNDQAVDAVAGSIRDYGWRQPIVVDCEGVIIVGHTRWKAAQKLGLAEVPVHVAADLPPEKARALRIADNKLGELAEWDMDLLPLELKDLQGMDFDIATLGFDDSELEKILGAGIHGNAGLTDPDDVPLPPDEAVTKLGDLWILGNHRLLCGDSAKPEDVDRLLNGAPIHLVNTDPPYNVKVKPRSNHAIAAGAVAVPGDQYPAVDGTRPAVQRCHHQPLPAPHGEARSVGGDGRAVSEGAARNAGGSQMKSGNRPPAKGYVSKYGYRRVRAKGSRKLRMEHVLVWEAAHGPVPDGREIHHINGDKLDNRLENLQLVTRLEHKRIHSGCVLKKDGWWKPCRRCGVMQPVGNYYGKPDGSIMAICRQCAISLATHYKRERRKRLRNLHPGQTGVKLQYQRKGRIPHDGQETSA